MQDATTIEEARLPVSIVIPYFRNPALVIEAAESILKQEHAVDLLLVISDGDGGVPQSRLEGLDPRRVIVYRTRRNRGNYFVREVARRALGRGWIGFVDADDYVEPMWVSALLDSGKDHAGAAFCGARLVQNDGVSETVVGQKKASLERVGGKKMIHFAYHTSIFFSERLEVIGGFDPSFRIGFDSLLINLIAATGPVGIIDQPLYIRRVAGARSVAASLTTSMTTRKNSRARRLATQRLRALYAEYVPMFRDDPAAARAALLQGRSSRLERQVAAESNALRGRLAQYRSTP